MCPYKGIELEIYGVGVFVHITVDKIIITYISWSTYQVKFDFKV